MSIDSFEHPVGILASCFFARDVTHPLHVSFLLSHDPVEIFFWSGRLEQRHLLLTVIEIDVVVGRSILHLFPWSGIIDENQELSNTFRVPDLKTGRMSRLITQLSPKEEEMFRNMIRRMNTIVKV